MNTEEVFELVYKRSDRLARMLSDIIKIDTSVPPGNKYPEMADYLEPLLQKTGLSTQRVVQPEKAWRKIPLPLEGERVNLVAAINSEKPPLSIYAHMDVVPAGGGWTFDPFEGKIDDKRVYGRGAVDMKGTIPPVIVALELIKELGLEPRFDVRVLLCTDEEIGIDPGAKYLAENGYFKPPILHLEGGSQAPVMIAANAGSLKVVITTKGREVHSGMSFLGVNALEQMVPVMDELMELKTVVEKRESSYMTLPLPIMPSDKLTPTFNLNMIMAGEKLNVVPGRCELQVDRRFLPDEDIDNVKQEILAAIDMARKRSKAEGIDAEFTTLYFPHAIDTESEHIRRWNEGVRLALDLPTEQPFLFVGATGSTDMSFVGKILKTDQFIGTGLFDLENIGAHQPDESVSIENLVHLCQELIYFLVDWDKT